MKKLRILLAFILLGTSLFAQSKKYETAIKAFQNQYNAAQYDSIFNSFSPEMKEAMPLAYTIETLTQVDKQYGKIKNIEFIGIENESYASYKTTFTAGILTINLSLDQQDNINGIFFKPYVAETSEQKAAINDLGSYPKPIATAIFNMTKDFPNHTQLSIAILDHGKTKYYGILKQNDTIKPVDNSNNVFEIGSITKVFTSTILASLVEAHKIKLTDAINPYYPFLFNDSIQLTFQELANHTAGLPRLPENLAPSNLSNPYKDYNAQDLDTYLQHMLRLDHTPSSHYAYSNIGASILGHTLSLSQKTSFKQLLDKRVLRKYHLNNTYSTAKGLDDILIKGLDSNGDIVANWDHDLMFPGGGILSTASDLAKFAQAQFNSKDKVLALTREPTFDINPKMKIGLGWHLITSPKGKKLTWHNGGTGGYTSSMAMDTTNKTAVIILSNVSGFHSKTGNIDLLCFELIDMLQ